MKKRLAALMLLLVLIMSGCTNAKMEAEEETEPVAESLNFILVCPMVDNEYWQLCYEGIKRADEELGICTDIIGSQSSEDFTAEIVESMREAIDKKPDGIMVYAGINALEPLINEATESGIPVLAIDSDAPNSSRVAYVGTDAYNAGFGAGEKMVSLAGESVKIGFLVSSLSAEKEMAVIEAFKDAVSDFDYEIVDIEETNADPDIAEEKAREMLSEHPEITAMFNTGGYSVTGAARVKKELQRDDLVLIGFDDVEENLKFIREDIINAIIVQRVDQVGYQSVYLLNEYIEKGKLSNTSYDTGTVTVTKDNVDTYNSVMHEGVMAGETVKIGYYTGDTAFQDGFTDGERKSGYAYDFYTTISELVGWKYEYVYGSRAEIMEKLKSGEVDIVAGVHKTESLLKNMLFSESDMGVGGDTPEYFAICKGREDIKREIDIAMDKIIEALPDYKNALYHKHYHQDSKQLMLTDAELEWLSSKKVIRIGYVKQNLPLCDQQSDGTPTGLISDLIASFSDYLHIEIEPVCFDRLYDMENSLVEGEIDAVFPMYSDIWYAERKGFYQSDSVISDRTMVVYDGSYSEEMMDDVALVLFGIGQKNYISTYYPDSKTTAFESRAEAFEQVANGNFKALCGSSCTVQRFLAEHEEYRDLSIAYLDISKEFSFAINNDNNILVGILNKAIWNMDTATITASMMKYSSVESTVTPEQVLKQYSPIIIIILITFSSLLAWLFLRYTKQTRRFNQAQEKTNKELEKALETAEKASEAKTTFLSSMSHDIRTPMNAIVGMTTIASQNINDSERIRDCLSKIELSSNYLLTLINNILDISKIESGKFALNPLVFSLKDTITNLANIVRPDIKAKSLDFDIHIHNMDHEVVYADALRVNQVFVNILSNAVKYTGEGGKVILDLYEELLPDEKTVRLTYIVEDTGVGMSKEYMEKMYDLFTRETDTRVSAIQGTGLGLSIVKQMVDMMNGTIECQSTPGVGTKFTVVLDMPIGEMPVENEPLDGVTVLVVDDDKIFLETARNTLGKIGVTPYTASSGKEAIKMIEAHHSKGNDFTIIIVDWHMPEMDGLETIKAIRELMGDKLPIILGSAYEWADIAEKAKACGADGFINKPLFKSCIYESIKELVSPQSEAVETSDDKPDNLSGLSVLVAEDNELNREIIVELLSMHGIKADCVENGHKCVEKISSAKEGTYDIILMDIQMPIMNGREATKLIRLDHRRYVNSIPIIAMTADAFAEDIAASLACGMDDHVSKPVDMDMLLQKIQKVLDKKGRKH